MNKTINIQIKNLDEIKVKVLGSTVYTNDEKMDIIRHKYTNYDKTWKSLPKKRYNEVVVSFIKVMIVQFPSLIPSLKKFHYKKLG